MITLLFHAVHMSLAMLISAIVGTGLTVGTAAGLGTYFLTRNRERLKDKEELISLRKESFDRQQRLQRSTELFVQNKLDIASQFSVITTNLQEHFAAVINVFKAEVMLTSRANLELAEVVMLLEETSRSVSIDMKPLMTDVHARLANIKAITQELHETVDCVRNTTTALQASINEYAAIQVRLEKNVQSYELQINDISQEIQVARAMATPNATDINQMEKALFEAANERRLHLIKIDELGSQVSSMDRIMNRIKQIEKRGEQTNACMRSLNETNHRLTIKIERIGASFEHNDAEENHPSPASTRSLTLFSK
jgi:chromosome segregation ATPase